MSVAHGGDVAGARARHGEPANGWLDLSTGLNPWAYPFLPPPAASWQRLPQSEELTALIAAAAEAYGVADAGCLVAAPGTQAILQWLPRLRATGHVAVLSPTYGEHAHCWRSAGHRMREIAALDEAGDADVIVVVNPNNPDGRLLAPETLLAVADGLAARGGWLVVDEAFADAVPEVSVAAQAGRPGLIVLRSFGKFYGLGGLRLGFALAPHDVVAGLRAALGPWAVAGPALAIGAQALADRAWAEEMRDRLRHASAGLSRSLRHHGLQDLGGTPLFRLAGHAQAAALCDHLARAGILVRAFAERPTWLRVGLADAAGLARLDAALGAWTKAAEVRAP